MDYQPETLTPLDGKEYPVTEAESVPLEPRIVGRSYNELPQPYLKQRKGFLREAAEIVLLVVAIYTLVNLSTARFVVEGSSMEPNFYTDQFVIVSRLAYIIGEPQRGDIIVFHYDETNQRDFIKRVVGLPGEHVELIDGRVYVNGQLLEEPYIEQFCTGCRDQEWYLEDDQYIVLGDNRNNSLDSADSSIGPIQRKQIIGQAWVRYWPPEDWQLVPHYDYGLPNPLPDDPQPTPDPVEELPEMDINDELVPGSSF